MEPTRLPGYEDARKRLLEAGSRSYLEVTTALNAFEQEVQKTCREVMEKNIGDFASAIGIQPRLKADEIQCGVWPRSSQWQENWRTVGVEILRKGITPAIRMWGAYCCLVWQVEDPKFYSWVSEWYAASTMAAGLFQKFQRLNPKVSIVDDHEVGLLESLGAEEGALFDEKLGGLFEEWIGLWEKVGGIKKVFRS